MGKRLFITILSLAIVAGVSAQRILPDDMQGRYHMLTYDELEGNYNNQNYRSIPSTSAPEGNVRSIAEWERNQGVIVAYPHSYRFGIPTELIKQLADDVHVYLIYDRHSDSGSIARKLIRADVDMANVSFHNMPVNSYWTRDYSPWFIVSGDDNQMGMVNFDYNRPARPDDNNIPTEFGDILNLPVYGMNIEHTGGNYMSDGLGCASSTDLVYDENSVPDAEVDSMMKVYLGIDNNMVVSDPLGDYIKHIDCWGKFLDVDKVLIAKVKESDYRYNDYEVVADYYSNQLSSYGNKYEVHRVYAPNKQPYTNSLIMNDKVYVPVPSYTYYGSDWNDEAIASYQEAMPGYTIVPVENRTSRKWLSTDALHCRTHEVPDLEMLHIKHFPIHGNIEVNESVVFEADVMSYGDYSIVDDSIVLNYRCDSSDWETVEMEYTENDTYSVEVSFEEGVETVEYYIVAQDESGRVESHPFIGAADPHRFSMLSTRKAMGAPEYESVLSVFPNPANDYINIATHYVFEEHAQVVIYNMEGVVVQTVTLNDLGSYALKRIDVSSLPSATYIVKLIGDGNVMVSKFNKL